MKTRAICQIEEMKTNFLTHPNIEKMIEEMTTMNLVLSSAHLIEEMEEIHINNGMLERKWVAADPDQEATQVKILVLEEELSMH